MNNNPTSETQTGWEPQRLEGEVGEKQQRVRKRKTNSGHCERRVRGKRRKESKEEREEESLSATLECPSSRRRRRRRRKGRSLSSKSVRSPTREGVPSSGLTLTSQDSSEGPSDGADGSGRRPPHCNDPTCLCRVFEEKYEEDCRLGSGSYGSVFAGLRKEDSLPVAVKHIPMQKVAWATANLDGRLQELPTEVVLLLVLSRGSPALRGVVRLLDWYKLQDEVLLVLERPVPSVDLFDFLVQKGGFLQESEAKVIMRQLVEAVLEIHGRGVVHRDIKLDNVLVQTGSGDPLIHVLDFGCGGMLSDSPYEFHPGTCLHMPPECFLRSQFHATPSTAWQLGVVLYQMLTRILPFSTPRAIIYNDPYLWHELSSDCQDLLRRCLDKRPRCRPTLEEILRHPWLQ